MKIIVLQGTANKGKTETLRKLDSMLKKKCSSSNVIKHSKREIYKTYDLNTDNKKFRVGIWSCGDYEDALRDGIDALNKKKCDIGIFACRTKGKGVEFLKKTAKSSIVFIGKSKAQDTTYHDILNESDANELMDVLNRI